MGDTTPNAADVRAFIERLIALSEAEQATEAAESSLLFSRCGYSLLELKGLALGGLHLAGLSLGLGGKRLLELERSLAIHETVLFPQHQFRSGDIVEIVGHGSESRAAGKERAGTEGVVFKVTDTRVVVAVGGGSSSGGKSEEDRTKNDEVEELNLPDRMRLLKLANPSTYNRQISTLKSLLRQTISPDGRTVLPCSPLISTLLGLAPLPPPTPLVSPLEFLDPRLNDTQKSAVRYALSDTPVALIWGPPGTGKTQTLIEVIRQYLAQDQRVFVACASNLAVDNIVERLSASAPGTRLTRIGHPARVMEKLVPYTLDAQSFRTNSSEIILGIKEEIETLLKELSDGKIRGKERKVKYNTVRDLRREFRRREGSVVQEVLSLSRCVLATTHGAGDRKLMNEKPFDVVIIDEAAQAVESSCWVAILKGKKLILAGDHLQLPPTINSGGEKKEVKEVKGKGGKEGVAKKVRGTAKKTTEKSWELEADKLAHDKAQLRTEEARPFGPLESIDQVVEGTAKTDISESAPTPTPPLLPSLPPQQPALPPLLRSLTSRLKPSPSLELTLFSRLLAMHGPTIRRMLKVQYRMNAKIMAFPSSALYDNELIADPSVKDRVLSDLVGVEADGEIDEPLVFIDTAGSAMFERLPAEDSNSLDADSKCNENEATLVVKHVQYLIEAGVLPSCIAVITPYNAQVALLSTLLHPRYPDLEIGSVDGFQGREKDAIVLCLVRSNDQREVGFLKEKRRLNVAMTRARRQLCIVGDSSTVSHGSRYLKSWMDSLEEGADLRAADSME